MEEDKTKLVNELAIGDQETHVFVEGFRSIGYWFEACVSLILINLLKSCLINKK